MDTLLSPRVTEEWNNENHNNVHLVGQFYATSIKKDLSPCQSIDKQG